MMDTQASFDSVQTRLLELQFVQCLQLFLSTTRNAHSSISCINVYTLLLMETPTAADVRYQQL